MATKKKMAKPTVKKAVTKKTQAKKAPAKKAPAKKAKAVSTQSLACEVLRHLVSSAPLNLQELSTSTLQPGKAVQDACQLLFDLNLIDAGWAGDHIVHAPTTATRAAFGSFTEGLLELAKRRARGQ